MSGDKISYYVETDNVIISKYHLCFLYVLISWSLVFLFIFVTQPGWIVGKGGYLSSFVTGSGVATTEGKASLTNTILSDQGRENLLWVSFLFALLVGLLVFVFFYF